MGKKKEPSGLFGVDALAKGREVAQACLTVVSLASVPVGAYVYLLSNMNRIESKMDTVVAVVLERQAKLEERTAEERRERREDVRQMQAFMAERQTEAATKKRL